MLQDFNPGKEKKTIDIPLPQQSVIPVTSIARYQSFQRIDYKSTLEMPTQRRQGRRHRWPVEFDSKNIKFPAFELVGKRSAGRKRRQGYIACITSQDERALFSKVLKSLLVAHDQTPNQEENGQLMTYYAFDILRCNKHKTNLDVRRLSHSKEKLLQEGSNPR